MENAGETRDSYGGDAEFVTCTVHPFRLLLPLVPPDGFPCFSNQPRASLSQYHRPFPSTKETAHANTRTHPRARYTFSPKWTTLILKRGLAFDARERECIE